MRSEKCAAVSHGELDGAPLCVLPAHESRITDHEPRSAKRVAAWRSRSRVIWSLSETCRCRRALDESPALPSSPSSCSYPRRFCYPCSRRSSPLFISPKSKPLNAIAPESKYAAPLTTRRASLELAPPRSRVPWSGNRGRGRCVILGSQCRCSVHCLRVSSGPCCVCLRYYRPGRAMNTGIGIGRNRCEVVRVLAFLQPCEPREESQSEGRIRELGSPSTC